MKRQISIALLFAAVMILSSAPMAGSQVQGARREEETVPTCFGLEDLPYIGRFFRALAGVLSRLPAVGRFFRSETSYKNPDLKMSERLEDLLKRMTIEEKVGQLVQAVVLEEGRDPAGRADMPSNKTRELIENCSIGSVILYSTLNPGFTANYTNTLQEWASHTRLGIPLLVSVDFETGAGYNVLDGVTFFPQQMGMAATGSLELAEKVAEVTAKEARAMGIHWIYSPVADVNTNPDNPVIGVRSFGDDPELVSDFVRAYVRGYENNGIISTPKHYPGHGDTGTDSHLDLPSVEYDKENLEKVHLKPFQAGIDEGASSIMTAHILVRCVDDELPATLSPEVLTDLLQKEQGFEGIIVTDAMSMGGVANYFGVKEASVLAVKAGCDVVMATGSYDDIIDTYSALLEGAKGGEISEERINESVRKILTKKFEFGLFEDPYVDPKKASEICGSGEAKELALEAAKRSITMVDNEDAIPVPNNSRVLVTGPLGAEEIAGKLEENGVDVLSYETKGANESNRWAPSDEDIEEAKELTGNADIVVVTTFSSLHPPLTQGQIDLVAEMKNTGKKVIVISLGLPYDILSLPDADSYIATYALNRWMSPRSRFGDITEPLSIAIAEVLTGAYVPAGTLPVRI